jgi:hypothetical protein
MDTSRDELMNANTAVETPKMSRGFERFVDHHAGQKLIVVLLTRVEQVKDFSEVALLVQDLHLIVKINTASGRKESCHEP